jgi:hypothetical protein
MREREMRQRVERFLQTRLRRMLAPATIGLGLAVSPGCPSSDPSNTDDAGMVERKDSAADQQVIALYMAPVPQDSSAPGTGDAAPDHATTKYMAPVPEDGGAPVKKDSGVDFGAVAVYSAPVPDAGPIATKYIAPVPDAGREVPLPMPEYMAPIPDAARELPMAQPDYMAQMPDSGPALRYMAQMPDAGRDIGGVVALYLAQQLPDQQS